jgi:DNA (cytosine-5)-methyltransferase 1
VLTYGSVCSGIEAATVAWHPLGWEPSFFSEIDQFPRSVLKHYYSNVPLHGDFTTIQNGDYAPINLLVGGTPCQSFSVAGLRGGMDDSRGNLALEYLALAARLRARWLVWENVPGVLSVDGGRAFGAFLGLLVKLGYGFAYRILDAQYCGVPQRRRRVFVVGYLGDWRRAAAVLFEKESLQWDSPPSREARQDITGTVAARTRGGGGFGTDFDPAGGLQCFGGNNQASEIDVATACNAHGGSGRMDFESETFVAHALRADGFDASEDGPGRGTPLVPIAFDLRGREGGAMPEGAHDTANIRSSSGGSSRSYVAGTLNGSGAGMDRASGQENEADFVVQSEIGVRRLTPQECERLQGFPDDYTLVPYRSKPAKDGPRYKAIGNAMAVPCMAWLGLRIQMVENL